MAHPAGSIGTSTRVAGGFSKRLLWTLLALAVLWVIASNEVPLLTGYALYRVYRAQLIADRWIFIPHAICGAAALVIGPLQFSARLRARSLRLHRVLGRVYVYAVFIAALIALYISWPRPLRVATCVQAGAWIICTLAAFLTARNRQIAQHRQWMARSYAVTFTFITTRLLSLWPTYWNLSDADNALVIILVTFGSLLMADLGMNWRELTRARL